MEDEKEVLMHLNYITILARVIVYCTVNHHLCFQITIHTAKEAGQYHLQSTPASLTAAICSYSPACPGAVEWMLRIPVTMETCRALSCGKPSSLFFQVRFTP